MRNYANIDAIERVKRNKFSLKKTTLVLVLSAGIGAAAFSSINKNNDDSNAIRHEQQYNADDEACKVFNSYLIQKGDTLTSIVNKIMEEFPITADYYTTKDLIKEVVNINKLSGSGDKIVDGNYIIVPYYTLTKTIEERDKFYEEKRKEADALESYEEYRVKSGDSYWKIACMYTNDDNEIVRLVKEIQDLNGYESLRADTTITIPNVEKYKLRHAEYEESTNEIQNKSL